MANNATNVWKWIGVTNTDWKVSTNWTDGDNGAVGDFPDNALDVVTLVDSSVNAMASCATEYTLLSITQGPDYAGACCVAHLTVGTVTVTGHADGVITGGTITTLTASNNTAISGGTITTANLSGTATATGGTITTANCTGASLIAGATVTTLNWNSTGAQAFGTFGATINAYQDLLFDGGNVTFDGTLTSINVMRRGVSVKFAFAVHTWAGKLTILAQYLYGMGEAGGMLDA